MTQTAYQQPPTSTAVLPEYVITQADKDRVKRIQEAWKAYHGELDKPLQRMPGQPDDNVMSNRMQPIVDGGVDFLFGKEIEISVEEGAPQEAQDFLNEVWGRKEARIPLLQKWAMNGAICGSAVLRIVPGNDGSFRIVNVDPATVYVQTAPQDCDTIVLYCIQYAMTEKINGQDRQVYYREEIKRIDATNDEKDYPYGYEDTNADGLDADVTWHIQHWTQVAASGQEPKQSGWQVAGDPIEWEYDFPPLFMCQNLPYPNDPWGLPDITPDLIGMNNALNLVQSSANRVLKMYGQPILFAVGVASSRLDIVPGKIIGLDDVNGKIESVAITSDTATALTFAQSLRSDMDEQSKVPGVATGRIEQLPRGNMSGIAIELLFMPILKKTDKKRCTYGEVIIELSKALLVLNNMSEDIDIEIAWQNPLPNDDLQSAQAAVMLKQIGISDTTLQRQRGYDPEEEMQLSQAEDAKKLIAFSQGQGMPPSSAQMAGMPPTQPGQAPMPAAPQAAQPPAFMGRQS
jgi:hypothetical protein